MAENLIEVLGSVFRGKNTKNEEIISDTTAAVLDIRERINSDGFYEVLKGKDTTTIYKASEEQKEIQLSESLDVGQMILAEKNDETISIWQRMYNSSSSFSDDWISS